MTPARVRGCSRLPESELSPQRRSHRWCVREGPRIGAPLLFAAIAATYAVLGPQSRSRFLVRIPARHAVMVETNAAGNPHPWLTGAPLSTGPSRRSGAAGRRVPVGRPGVVPRPRRGPRISCRAYLETLRWPDGVRCPRCDSADTARLEARKKFYCRSCRYHFSVTSGTLFHNSHLPTWKWFLTISLMIQSEDGLPANQLVELLGVTYKTAWFAEHRVRAALQDGRAASPPCPRQTTRRAAARARVFARPLVGSYQQLELKYLPAYLAEIAWRSESRQNPYAFRDTVLRLLGGDPLAYSAARLGPRVSRARPAELRSDDTRAAERRVASADRRGRSPCGRCRPRRG